MTEVKERGCMVDIHPAVPHVFIPNAQLDARKVTQINFNSLITDQVKNLWDYKLKTLDICRLCIPVPWGWRRGRRSR